ncbi:hypothetical protein [Ectopseudomonas mendocina]|uniref:hypothetical protein n=1 Tax=Ectopseudomonas mendocina TaxID=300 RepID=UPI003EFD90D9
MTALAFDEDDCLSLNPFEGDFGDGRDRCLKDRFVTAGKDHLGICHDCGGDIAKGERHRSRVDIADGEFFAFRWCRECCAAQALSWEDDGRLMEVRCELGRSRREGRTND